MYKILYNHNVPNLDDTKIIFEVTNFDVMILNDTITLILDMVY